MREVRVRVEWSGVGGEMVRGKEARVKVSHGLIFIYYLCSIEQNE